MLERTHVPRWLSLFIGFDDFFGLLTRVHLLKCKLYLFPSHLLYSAILILFYDLYATQIADPAAVQSTLYLRFQTSQLKCITFYVNLVSRFLSKVFISF